MSDLKIRAKGLLALFFFLGLSCASTKESKALILGTSQIVFSVQGQKAKPDGKSFSGNVSWYGPAFNGRKTASGEIFDMHKLTAAHLTLPFGTRVLVEDPRTGNTVIVKVNDRGPYVKSRVMDLAREGARRLGTLSRGVVYVDCLILGNQ